MKYAIYRITTGEFRTEIVGYSDPIKTNNPDGMTHQTPIKRPKLFSSKREAQDIINILAQLPDTEWPRDENYNIIKPVNPQRCKEEYEIIEVADDAIVAYTQR